MERAHLPRRGIMFGQEVVELIVSVLGLGVLGAWPDVARTVALPVLHVLLAWLLLGTWTVCDRVITESAVETLSATARQTSVLKRTLRAHLASDPGFEEPAWASLGALARALWRAAFILLMRLGVAAVGVVDGGHGRWCVSVVGGCCRWVV